MESSTIHCPVCNQDLSINEFGICRARSSGRNLYCKACIRRKVKTSREERRKWKAGQRELARAAAAKRETKMLDAHQVPAQQPATTPPKNSPAFLRSHHFNLTDRVLTAISLGAKTYKEIWRMVESRYMSKDDIGVCLAKLLLDTHEIRTEMEGDTRVYFTAVPPPRHPISRSNSQTIWQPAPASWMRLAMPVIRGAQR